MKKSASTPSDFKIDDEIMVSQHERGIKLYGGVLVHFAGMSDDGKVLAFEKSLTSDMTDRVVEWNYWSEVKKND